MKDTQKILRTAVFQMLNGNISIPVYDEKKRIGSNAKIYALLSTQQETDENPSDAFITLSSIDIEIIHRSDFEVTKDSIDDISTEILEILIPTPTSDGLIVQNLFQITNVRRISTITRQISLTETENIVSKIINITCHIIEQT